MSNNKLAAFTESDKFKYNIFEFCASFLIIGSPMSGKSYSTFDLLKNIKNEFDKIVVFLGTKDSAPAYLDLADDKKKKGPVINVIFKYNGEDFMKYLLKTENENIELIKRKKPVPRQLFIFDDILGLPSLMSYSRSSPSGLATLASNYRHYGISFIVCNQTYMDCIKNVRLTAKYIIIAGVGLKDMLTIFSEHENIYFPSKDLVIIYKKLRENPYHMLLINNAKPDRERFWEIHSDLKTITNIKPLHE